MTSSVPTPVELFFTEIRPAIENILKDGLTGYWLGIHYRHAVGRHASRHSRSKNVQVFCVGFDIRNVGGANALLNWTGVANKIFKPFTRLFKDALERTVGNRAQCLLFRQGGDEFSAIVAGVPGRSFRESHLRTALNRFSRSVDRYNRRHRFDRIKNPKEPGKPGVGVVHAYVQLTPHAKIEHAFEKVDTLIEKRKKEHRGLNEAMKPAPI